MRVWFEIEDDYTINFKLFCMENIISPIKRGFGLSFFMYSSLHLQLGRTQQVEGAEGRGEERKVEVAIMLLDVRFSMDGMVNELLKT